MGKQSRRLNRRTRKVPMTPEVEQALKEQLQSFKEKFGREAGPNDPVFFDPDEDTPQPMTEEKMQKGLIDGMVAAGLDPSYIYAYQKTGLIVTESNWETLSPEDQAEWQAAISEWENLGKQ